MYTVVYKTRNSDILVRQWVPCSSVFIKLLIINTYNCCIIVICGCSGVSNNSKLFIYLRHVLSWYNHSCTHLLFEISISYLLHTCIIMVLMY